MPQRKPVVHIRDIRLRNNAGMDFPVCYASAELLDLDKSRLPNANLDDAIASGRCCKRCQHAYARRYGWARPRDGWPWEKGR